MKRKTEKEIGMETQLEVRSFDSKLTPEEFADIPRLPVTVILENLRSAFNVGSIVRTADCALIDHIIFTGITACPPHKKLEKTSLGALPYVSWSYNPTVLEAVQEEKKKGKKIVALELTNKSKRIWNYSFEMPTTLVMGNEALGVSKEVLAIADDIVEIPMLGFKNSLNVAVAFGIVAYEIQRQQWGNYLPRWHTKEGNPINKVASPNP